MWLPRAILSSLLPRYSRGDLPAFLRRAVAERLRTDVDLAADYEALRALELAALSSTSASTSTSAGQRELLLSSILDDAPAETSAAREPAWQLPLGIAATCAIVVVIGFPVVADDEDAGHAAPLPRLTARGDVEHAPLGVRVRCVARVDGNDVVVADTVAGARQHDGTLTCPDGGTLAFSFTNLGTTARTAFLVGIAANDDVIAIAPFARDAAGIVVPAGSVDVIVPTLAPMPTLDERGATLHLLVSDDVGHGVSGADVFRQLEAAQRDRLPLSALDRLPVDVDVQARVHLYPR